MNKQHQRESGLVGMTYEGKAARDAGQAANGTQDIEAFEITLTNGKKLTHTAPTFGHQNQAVTQLLEEHPAVKSYSYWWLIRTNTDDCSTVEQVRADIEVNMKDA